MTMGTGRAARKPRADLGLVYAAWQIRRHRDAGERPVRVDIGAGYGGLALFDHTCEKEAKPINRMPVLHRAARPVRCGFR